MPDLPGPGFPRPARPDRREGEPTGQRKALDLAEGFREHDLAALARLTRDELAEQAESRELLRRYVDHMWDFIKEYRGHHAARNPAYSAVMGMRDLTAALCDHAAQASLDAEEDLGD